MEKLRQEIDAIDEAMRILFEKRMDCVKEIIDYKLKNQIEIKDLNREETMIENNLRKLKNPDYCQAYECFLREIIRSSVEFQEDWQDQKNNK